MSTAVIGGVVGLVVVIVLILVLKNKKKPEETQKTETKKEPVKQENKPKQEAKPKEVKKESIKLPDVFIPLTKEISELKAEIENNLKSGMDEYGMDRDTMVEMIKELKGQFAENKDPIYNLMAQKNWEEMETHIHTLKGSSLNLRFDILGKPIEYIDDMLKEEKELENLKYYVDVIYNNYEKVFSAL